MKSVKIEGSIFRADAQALTEEQFNDEFLNWLESKGYQFLGHTEEESE